ncbi:hypothetical protein BU14_0070s0002 [Porphyra umbilicalis]|uniref:Uncharacterized protein n=1 Tax=Porphyra umbilicalis TaxID=2786 RepID=A0A1X6PGF1_PORUM|nr:hypothetical protein BU14_0070s0002 [Porphyra umbilicalis]|eukprot:OSX79826.1 hypothetical protein BU14_0070s0002 [Porphyra umbilicalis]
MAAPAGNPRASFLSRRGRPSGGGGGGGGDGARSFLRRPGRSTRSASLAPTEAAGVGGGGATAAAPDADRVAAGWGRPSSPTRPSTDGAGGTAGAPPVDRSGGAAAAAGSGGGAGDAAAATPPSTTTRWSSPGAMGGRSFLRRPGGGGGGGASFLRKPARPPPPCGAGDAGGGGAPPPPPPPPPPPRLDGGARWAADLFSLPHNAVRRELMDLFKMLADAAGLGAACTAADVREVAAWWKLFHDFYLEYRGLEAALLLPWAGAARTSAPDLGYFLEALAEQRALLEGLRTDAHDAFRRLYAALEGGGGGGGAPVAPTGAAPDFSAHVPLVMSPVSSAASPVAAGEALASPLAALSVAASPGGPVLPPPGAADAADKGGDAIANGVVAAAATATATAATPDGAVTAAAAAAAAAAAPTVATLTVAAATAAVVFASKLVEYFGAQERFLPPVVHRHYADAKEKRRLTIKMVDALLGGRLPKDGLVLLVAWMDDAAALNGFLAKYVPASARLAYPRWLARFEGGHRAHVERLHLRAVAERAARGGGVPRQWGGARRPRRGRPLPPRRRRGGGAAAAAAAGAPASVGGKAAADPVAAALAFTEPLSPVERMA